jgi:hypothetical protein
MAYIGKGPSDTFSGVTSKDSFTGDGSTVIFDISTDIPQGGDTDIFVYVDNVRQEPGVSKAYTTGQDGNGNYRRITFTTAPDSGAEIYVLNPGRIEALQVTGDNSISATKIQSSAVTTVKINDGAVTTDKIAIDAITEAKIADAAVENEHLNTNVITGQTELAEIAQTDDVLLVYDTSTGTLKKVSVINLNLGNPTISSITPTNVNSKDSATTTTFIVTGTNFFTGTTAKLISNSATDISFTTVTRDSNTQLTCVLSNALVTAVPDEPYDIFVNNGFGTTTLTNQINVDQSPVFVTASGSLGSVTEGNAASFTVEATDPESAGVIRYDVVGGSLPTDLTLNSSTGVISGTAPAVAGDTTSTFIIQASDVNSNVSFREFSITVANVVFQSFTSSGTFSVPVGKTTVDVLVVAGGGGGASGGPTGAGAGAGAGGGGAGGLIFRPGFPVTPGGTVSVTVGCGGGIATTGQDSVFGTLTAKGGGQGGPVPRGSGGSGGSGGGGGAGNGGPGAAGTATQPTQPTDSGTYGFGNPGGAATGGDYQSGGGGGGGSGAVGGSGGGFAGSPGGVGRAYTIADGATSVYYAGGGGGGGGHTGGGGCVPAPGGQGGGGAGGGTPAPGTAGQANKGGGGGGGSQPANPGAAGGKGIVIVSY